MSDLKLKCHTTLIGTTGFNNHSQSFFQALSELVPLEIRNFTVGPTWKGLSDEPHNDEPGFNDTLKTLLVEQTLWNQEKMLQDFKIYSDWPNPGAPNVNLILGETNHHYFYQPYNGYTIAYNVWESTLYPTDFFNRLKEFDELWVPSTWQMECAIKQGYPAEKISVVPEGVDDQFFPETVIHPLTSNGRFTFAIFGRWDYRKATQEMIQAFLKEFDPSEPVDLILSVDNQFANDGLATTEERLEHFGLADDRIKIVHLPPREEYINLLKSVNVFVSCSRSEGWNLPLIEAMACGTPSIYSNASGQLEFAEGKGLPVKILGEKPVNSITRNHFNSDIGNYYEPDFEDLARVMRDAYVNYKSHKDQALQDSVDIRNRFNWRETAKTAHSLLEKRKDLITAKIAAQSQELAIKYHAIKGAYVELVGGEPAEYKIEITDRSTGRLEYSEVIRNNMWVKTNKQYYVDWHTKVTDVKTGTVLLDAPLDLKGNRVLITLDSSSLGDNLSWFPAVEEFRKKHQCKVVCSTYLNDLFKPNYPEIEFISPGSQVENVVAMYSIGWYYDPVKNQIKLDQNPREVKNQPMQKAAFDILGLDFVETRAKLTIPKVEKQKKISIAIHGTCQSKYWNNPTGWQELVDWCTENGYEVVLLSVEQDGFMGNFHPTGIRHLPRGPLTTVIEELESSAAFVGIGSGLSWLAWTTSTPIVLISGFSEDYTEMQDNVLRVTAPTGACSGCFNHHRLDPSDWNWCPVYKGTDRQFECSKLITSSTVIGKLEEALGLI
jgi:autotransporter strand-loop-strand O-heptosyltransferase